MVTCDASAFGILPSVQYCGSKKSIAADVFVGHENSHAARAFGLNVAVRARGRSMGIVVEKMSMSFVSPVQQ